MSDPVSEDQDQRNNAGLEDLTTMTIESLRRMLLSERDISKAAKQRADELAKRVAELEEQLKIVSLHRKKAEKALADVIAILECNGIGDASDSSSDSVCDSKIGNDTLGKESSTNFDLRRNDMEAYSSSEIDSSPSTGRSLSRKSSKDSLHCRERIKSKDSNRRRCSSFSSNNSLPKRGGKSGWQIRRRETRSAPDETLNDDNMHDVPGITVTKCSQDLPNSDIGPETMRKSPNNNEVNDLAEPRVSGISGNGVVDADFAIRKGQVEDMENDHQHEAQHAGQYEAEEKSQREWEEKFREENSCLLDSCDPGNRSDVTEERDEVKATEQAYPAGIKKCLNKEREQEILNSSFSEEKPKVPCNILAPPDVDNRQTQDQKTGSMLGQESSSSEFAFPTSKGTHKLVFPENHDSRLSEGSFMYSISNSFPGNPLTRSTSSSANNGECSGSNKEIASMSQKPSNNLESVLDALQQAKLSLKHQLHSIPQLEVGSSGKGIESSILGGKSGDRMTVPIRCPAGLFRSPADFQLGKSATANYLCSDSSLRLPNCYLQSAHDKLIARPLMESRPSSSIGDPFCASTNIASMEMGSRIDSYTPHFTEGGSGILTSATPFTEITTHIPAMKPAFEPPSDARLFSTGRSTFLDSQMNAGFPFLSKSSSLKYPLSPDVAPQLSSGERFPKSIQGMEIGMPSTARFSFYDDHIRPTMYK